jgi:galactarate dehydratase
LLVGMPAARGIGDLPQPALGRALRAPLEGYAFAGCRNPDGSVDTHN